MKTTKRILSTLLCLILIAVCGFTASAADTAVISLSNVTAMPGESVAIDISISNNPGIMAMSFCITYDSDAFEYTGYTKGYLSRYTIKDHSDKGQIAFVNDEASDKSNNGVMLSVKFKVKDNAAPGKHTITIANQNREKYGTKLHNSFSNSDLKHIVPSVVPGSITVGETCENAGHKYGDWTVITPADCVSTGSKEHTCLRCYYTETVDIPITHDFEADWTVDKAATPTEDGTMSRHCKNCDAVTDEITFTYKEVEDSQTPDDNTSSDDGVSSEDTSSDNTSIDVSSEENSSDGNSSSEQGSQNSTPSNNTSSSSGGNSSSGSTSTKTPIKNTVGAKNPQSAVEGIKDYQENIKPNIDKNTSSNKENTDTESNTVLNSSDTETDIDTNSNNSKPAATDNTDSDQTSWSAGNVVLLVVSGVISLAIIALAIILILKRKKETEE